MEQRERVILALTGLPGIGARKIKLLLGAVHQPEELFRLTYKDLTDIPGVGPYLAKTVSDFDDWERVDQILDQTEKSGSLIISRESEAYPELLRQLPEAPLLLWAKGNTETLKTDAVAVVGTRNASSYGKAMAAKFTAGLVQEGFTITSGLAYGIDTEAHRSCVEKGGKTIAVLGSGIDRIYPNVNIPLAHKLMDRGGVIVSEFPPGTKPDARNFPVRNRVVSGLSLGTVVVESDAEGGSMITAGVSLDQNRDVFAIPHSLETGNGQGGNMLIKNGQAKLVQDFGDVTVELNRFYTDSSELQVDFKPTANPTWEDRSDLDEESRTICRSLNDGALHVDVISEHTGIPTDQLLVKLLELEFKDCVKQNAGKYFELS